MNATNSEVNVRLTLQSHWASLCPTDVLTIYGESNIVKLLEEHPRIIMFKWFGIGGWSSSLTPTQFRMDVHTADSIDPYGYELTRICDVVRAAWEPTDGWIPLKDFTDRSAPVYLGVGGPVESAEAAVPLNLRLQPTIELFGTFGEHELKVHSRGVPVDVWHWREHPYS